MSFRYIAIEGPTGTGKTALAERLATRLEAALVLEETDNPFLDDFYSGRPGAALHAQIFFLLGRHRQQQAFQQADLFTQAVVCDYLFDKDRIFAYLNLDDNELFVYQRLYELLSKDIAQPDLVIYLQAPVETLVRRLRDRDAEDHGPRAPVPSAQYLRELHEAYQHFFFHYAATPLLVVDTTHADFAGSDQALDELIRQIRTMGRGTMYYVPRP